MRAWKKAAILSAICAGIFVSPWIMLQVQEQNGQTNVQPYDVPKVVVWQMDGDTPWNAAYDRLVYSPVRYVLVDNHAICAYPTTFSDSSLATTFGILEEEVYLNGTSRVFWGWSSFGGKIPADGYGILYKEDGTWYIITLWNSMFSPLVVVNHVM